MTRLPDTDEVVSRAIIAFWNTVVTSYPHAQTGDLSIERTFALHHSAIEAVSEWVAHCVPQ